ncbi:STAS domain-containing protein [Candidatus Gracilibacteria bacterium]|nr:STAS domain-containing protein [Candidatus Gracilibacteria bacterium]
MDTFLRYFRSDFRHDMLAGIVVGLVALPLAIAFALASGATPEQGLYTAIIGGGIMAILAGSQYQVSGPTGAFVVILLGVVNKFGMEGLLLAGGMAGIILILMGIFRFGVAIQYIPYPVVVGFTAGIGCLLFTGQIKNVLGLSFSHLSTDFFDTLNQIFLGIQQGINFYSLGITLFSLLVYGIWKKCNKKIPPSPIVILLATAASLMLPMGSIPTVGDIPTGLPHFHFLHFSWDQIKMILPSAFTIALLGAIESLMSAVVGDGMTGTKHNSNKELIAQGIGNLILPFFGGIPATGAIARTATNIRNGARTRWAGVIHAMTLLAIVLLFARYVRYIPMASLGFILMVVAYNMSEIPHFVDLFKAPRRDVLVLLTTFFLTVFVDLVVATGVGIVLAALLFIRRVSEINIHSLEDHVESGDKQSLLLHQELQDFPEIALYDINGPLFFGVASSLQDRIESKINKVLVLRLKHVHIIDATAMHALEVIIDKIHKRKGKVILSSVCPKVSHALEKVGLTKSPKGADAIVHTTREAVDLAKKIFGEIIKKGK